MDRTEKMMSLVIQWRESGQSQREFCLSHGVTLGKFSYWVAKSKEGFQGDGFIPVVKGSSSGTSPVCVIYPNGVRLQVETVDLGLLSRLIRLY